MSFRRAGTALLTTVPRRPAPALAALLAVSGLAGCWGHVSDVDLVADAAVTGRVLEPGVYCPVQIWSDFTEVDYADCDRVGWDGVQGRHYYADARVRWDDELQRPAPAPALDGFGATSIWLDAAEIGRGLTVLQRASADGGDFGEDVAVPGRYVAFVILASDSGFAVLPTADAAALRSLAQSRDVVLEPYEIDDAQGLRIVSGGSAAARAVVAEAAKIWLEARREASNDFRQLPANRSEIGPLYYVRLDDLDPSLPVTAAIESAMFEIEQKLRATAAP